MFASVCVSAGVLLPDRASADSGKDPSQVTWQFFEACSSGNLAEAWEMTAPILRARKDISILKQAAEKLELKPSTLWTWNILEHQRNSAIVQGRGTHSDGTYSAVKVTLIESEVQPLIYSIEVTSLKRKTPNEEPAPFTLIGPCESLAEVTDFPLPTKSSVIEKSQATLDILISMLKHPTFNERYAKAVKITPRLPQRADFEATYRLKDYGVDPDSTPRSEWQVSIAPEVNPACLLRAETYCDIGALRLQINHNLALTAEGWKPIEIDLTVVPPPEELKQMIRKVITNFNNAIQRGSFEEFHRLNSNQWRAKTAPYELENAFRHFLDSKQELPISDDTPIDLVENGTPVSPGQIQVSGSFDLPKNRAWFRFKFLYQAPEWKLHAMKLTTRPASSGPPEFLLK
jgi:hypothetical protein